jgi:hypothetical protein
MGLSCSDETLDLYLGCAHVGSAPSNGCDDCGFARNSTALSVAYGNRTRIKPRGLTFQSFPIHEPSYNWTLHNTETGNAVK